MSEPGSLSQVESGLTPAEFAFLNQLIEARFGLVFPEHKKRALETRLRPRVEALGLRSFGAYCRRLEENAREELPLMAKATTNNETYFFRERHQFSALFDGALPTLRPGLAVAGRLRILCAGVSSGEEAYTVAFYAGDYRFQLADARVQIDAFDLDADRVASAQRAHYRTRSLREMTPEQIRQYLAADGDDGYRVKDAFRREVGFRVANIVELGSFRTSVPYDVIFCRNVLIYFSRAALRRAIDNFAAVLRPGGLLFLGHSESIIGLSDRFEPQRLGGSIAYRRTEVR